MEWILLLMESFQKAEEEEENGMKMEVAEVLGAAAEEKMVVARLLDRVKMGEKGQGGLTIMAAAAAADLYLWELMAPKAPAEKAVLAFLILLLLAHILLAGGAEEHFMAVLSARAAWAAAGMAGEAKPLSPPLVWLTPVVVVAAAVIILVRLKMEVKKSAATAVPAS